MTRTHRITAVLIVALCLCPRNLPSMVFRSAKVAAHWDTWCYFYDGTYYLYYLITEHSPGEGFGVATSNDGVHWQDHGWALRASSDMVAYLGSGAVWKDPQFEKTGRFLCNYSEWRKGEMGTPTQNILFAWSRDLIHWNKFGDERMFRVDERFYARNGRWDCIYPMPGPRGGYFGTWTATRKGEKGGGIGIGFSEDGIVWKALPAPEVEPPAEESGAFWQIGECVYAMFGVQGRMDAYVASQVEGPYRHAEKNPILLSGGDTYFARFFPTPRGLLVNHQSMSGATVSGRPITYVAPLKRAVADSTGVLRFRYWEGNEELKGQRLNLGPESPPTSVTMLTPDLNFSEGIVAEGLLRLPLPAENEPRGLCLWTEGRRYDIRVTAGAEVEIGAVGDQEWKPAKRVYRDWFFGPTVKFRLLARRGMLEVYLDDQFIECYTMKCPNATRVRLGALGNRCKKAVTGVKIWQMSLGG